MKTHFILALATVVSLGQAGWLHTAPEPKFRMQEIDAKVGIGYGVTTADVDGDGKTDVVLVDKDVVAWYRNPGWERHVILEKATEKDHVCIAAADVDGDGKAEIALGAGWNPGDTVGSGALFYLVPPADRTRKWEPVRLPHDPTTHRIRWTKNWEGQTELVVAPLHGKGNNAGTGEGEGVRIQAYRMPADPRQEWPTRLLNGALHKTHNFDPIQWDDDPAAEFLIASKEGVFLVNWSADDNALKSVAIGTNTLGGAGEVRLGKAAGGGRFVAAIEPMHGNTLAIYRPPAGGTPAAGKPWDRLVLDESLVDGHALACGDLLGTGSDQIVVGWRAMNRPGVRVGVKLMIPEAGENRWRSVLIDDNGMACEDLCLADLNGDKRPDIVAAGRGTKNLRIYWNETAK